MEKSLEISIKTKNLNPSDAVTILSFLLIFIRTCEANGVHERGAIWILNYFMKEPTETALNSRMTHKAKNARTDGKLTSYCATARHLLKTYATDYVIDAAENDLVKCLQPDRMTEEDYAAEVSMKALPCGYVYLEERLKGIIIEGLHSTVRKNVRNYYANKGDEEFGKLA